MSMVMWGLLLDAVGFVLVFAFGGFSIGRAVILAEHDQSDQMAKWKMIGAIMVVSGFLLQFVGNWLA